MRSSNGSNFASTDVGLKASNPRVFFGVDDWWRLTTNGCNAWVFITEFVKDGFESLLLDVMTFYDWICIILHHHQYDMSMFACHLCRLWTVKVIYRWWLQYSMGWYTPRGSEKVVDDVSCVHLFDIYNICIYTLCSGIYRSIDIKLCDYI